MMELLFETIRQDGKIESDHDALVRLVTPRFDLRVNGQSVYAETEFPLLELAFDLAQWRTSPEADFRFQSVESDEPSLFSFVKSNGRWVIENDLDRNRRGGVGDSEFQQAVDDYIKRVAADVHRFGIDFDSLVARLAQA